jgi:hypothetical protein
MHSEGLREGALHGTLSDDLDVDPVLGLELLLDLIELVGTARYEHQVVTVSCQQLGVLVPQATRCSRDLPDQHEW